MDEDHSVLESEMFAAIRRVYEEDGRYFSLFYTGRTFPIIFNRLGPEELDGKSFNDLSDVIWHLQQWLCWIIGMRIVNTEGLLSAPFPIKEFEDRLSYNEYRIIPFWWNPPRTKGDSKNGLKWLIARMADNHSYETTTTVENAVVYVRGMMENVREIFQIDPEFRNALDLPDIKTCCKWVSAARRGELTAPRYITNEARCLASVDYLLSIVQKQKRFPKTKDSPPKI